MRKVWTTFLFMFSLFFLFSFSSAEVTFTFEEGKYSNYGKAYTNDYDSYLSDSASISTLEPNQISPALPDLIVPDDTVSNYPYQTFIRGAYSGSYTFIFSKKPLMAKSSTVAKNDYVINQYTGLYYETGKDYFIKYSCSSSGTSWNIQGVNPASNNVFNSGAGLLPIYYANYDLMNYNTKTQVYFGSNSEDRIVMENPLSDEEIKSILEIFLESVRNADLPEHYGRYVLTYNKVTGRYTGFVYPNYIDLGIKYGDFDDKEKFYYVQDSVGNYYHFSIYEKDTSAEWFTDYLIYEFRSNSTNTFFNFNTTYKLYDKLWGEEISFISSTLDEPIIYTSHKIYSMFFQETIHSTGNNIFYLDEETSIIKQDFKDDVGIDIDNSINESTNTNTNVNLLSFLKVLFDFILSLVSFLVRFFAFIVTFIIVPASTTILPEGFVQGIEWIHTFAFGEVLLWDIFSISFGVLLSIYIVKLIRSH